MTVSSAARADAWLAVHRDELVAQLSEWVRIPSVAGSPELAGELERSARWLAAVLRDVGFPTVEIWTTESGPPSVFAQWHAAADAPTVLVYSHHDVRTADADEWRACPPFEPVLSGNRLVGRGSSDAKGQVMAHVWGLKAYLATSDADAPPVNISMLVEGEEELGSPNLAGLLQRHADRVRADLVVLSDTMTWAADRPAVCTGNRGMMKATVEIRAAGTDTHAGAVAGAALNASDELVRVLSGLHDADGRVSVPGFYDEVDEPSDDERDALGRLTADESEWARRVGLRGVRTEAGRSLGEALFTRPAIEVVMLASGDAQPPTSGTMPASATAELEISLVPRQDPARVSAQLRSWFATRSSADFEHQVTVDETINQPPYETPPGHPVLTVLDEVMSAAWGCEVGRMRNAGGAPTALLADAASAPVAFFGTGLPEDGWHGVDESVDLDVLLKGAVAMSLFWPRLAHRMSRRTS